MVWYILVRKIGIKVGYWLVDVCLLVGSGVLGLGFF